MQKNYLSYLPISLFGSVMGLSGLSIAWKLASKHFALSQIYSQIIGVISIIVFIILSIAYIIKMISSTQSFKDEFNSALTKGFFGTFIIAVLLLPIVIYEWVPKVAFFLWIIGVILMFLFAVHMVIFWFNNSQNITHVTPAWVIPVVGTLDIPLAQNLFHLNTQDIGIAALGIGLFFAIPIFTIIKTKLLFNDPMPDKLVPTLMILLAPFSVGFSAYVEVVGKIDIFAKALYFIGLFLFFGLVTKLTKIAKCCPFKVTWWAVSFPLAALLISTLKMANVLDELYLNILSFVFLVGVTLIIIWLFFKTMRGIIDGELKNLI